RREAILALAEIGEAAAPAVDAITAAMDDETDQIVATYALGRLGQIPPEAESRIRENAHSPDSLLRTVSVWTLARIYPADEPLRKEAFRQLVESLKSEEPQVRTTAARALVALDPDPNLLAPMLEEALRDADEQTTQYALDAVARVGSVMVPQLIGALRFESLRPRVVFLLGEIGSDAEAAVEALVELIKAPDRPTREETLLALAKIGPAASAAVPALTVALHQPEGTCRYGAAYALGRIGPPAESAIPTLLEATRNSDDTLALLSAWALAQIAPKCKECAEETVPILVRGLEHPNAKHRRESAAALGALGPLARVAVPALEQAAADANLDVRAAAAAALVAVR
ncbi:MAG: HEAT repeat domain-containing protein, partial [Patescibacteria group bacterium]|nr:HEAT repeat domain-containing protein [Patescibacteria group bacterium]